MVSFKIILFILFWSLAKSQLIQVGERYTYKIIATVHTAIVSQYTYWRGIMINRNWKLDSFQTRKKLRNIQILVGNFLNLFLHSTLISVIRGCESVGGTIKTIWITRAWSCNTTSWMVFFSLIMLRSMVSVRAFLK